MRLKAMPRVVVALAVVVLGFGCDSGPGIPKYELRWCINGQATCPLSKNEGTYIRGGFFYSLDSCNNAIHVLRFEGYKVGGTCIETSDLDRERLKGGKLDL
jgi:hypothetical protein